MGWRALGSCLPPTTIQPVLMPDQMGLIRICIAGTVKYTHQGKNWEHLFARRQVLFSLRIFKMNVSRSKCLPSSGNIAVGDIYSIKQQMSTVIGIPPWVDPLWHEINCWCRRWCEHYRAQWQSPAALRFRIKLPFCCRWRFRQRNLSIIPWIL